MWLGLGIILLILLLRLLHELIGIKEKKKFKQHIEDYRKTHYIYESEIKELETKSSSKTRWKVFSWGGDKLAEYLKEEE